MDIYPAIDLRAGRCVRLQQGDYNRETVFSDDPVSVATEFVGQGADRLHLVDLDGAKAGHPVNGEVVRRIVRESGVPCQLGGGLRSEADLDAAFETGVRWSVLGTVALRDPAFAIRMAAKFPGQIVLGLDARDGFVATAGWLETSQTPAAELVRQFANAGFAAVVYTDIARDGMMQGPNVPALQAMRAATAIPVIASGGVSTAAHVHELRALGFAGCIVGRALYEGAVRLADILPARPAAT